MSTDPADAAVREQLGQQADTVTGTPSAGIFGDTAGASQPPQPMDVTAATPTSADPDKLLAQLQAQQEQINALVAAQKSEQAEREAAKPAPAEPVDVAPRLANASGEVQQAFLWLHKRLSAIEEHLNLSAIEAVLKVL